MKKFNHFLKLSLIYLTRLTLNILSDIIILILNIIQFIVDIIVNFLIFISQINTVISIIIFNYTGLKNNEYISKILEKLLFIKIIISSIIVKLLEGKE